MLKKKSLSFIFLLIGIYGLSQEINQSKTDIKNELTKVENPSEAGLAVSNQPIHDLTIYPNLPNLTKNVIMLDALPNEKIYKIEFYAVLSAEVDNCNKHYLLGDFEVKNLEGYGYPYYIFNSNSQIISTKLGCANDEKKLKSVNSGKTEFVKYASLLPIVVYTPKNIDIRYKIWKQDPKELEARRF